MDTKRTILSEKELNLIKEIIIRHSIIVTFPQIFSILKKQMSRQAARNLVNKLSKNGWLVRIKKGIYAIANLESRGMVTTPVFKVAQLLVRDSYVSFEAALQNYGMFDQMLKTIISVSLKRQRTKEIQGIAYKYIYGRKELFCGWEEKRIENYLVKVATPEKAILDMLTFKRGIYTVDMVLEKLTEFRRDFDFYHFNTLSKKHPKAVQRILGFLFDKLSIDSQHLYNSVKEDKGCSYMAPGSKKFNAKWRLYYHKHFD